MRMSDVNCILILPGVVRLGNKLKREVMSVVVKRKVAKARPATASALVPRGVAAVAEYFSRVAASPPKIENLVRSVNQSILPAGAKNVLQQALSSERPSVSLRQLSYLRQ